MNDEELKKRLALQTLKYIRDVAEYIETKLNDGWFLTDGAWSEIARLGDRACRTTQCDDLKALFPQQNEDSDS